MYDHNNITTYLFLISFHKQVHTSASIKLKPYDISTALFRNEVQSCLIAMPFLQIKWLKRSDCHKPNP